MESIKLKIRSYLICTLFPDSIPFFNDINIVFYFFQQKWVPRWGYGSKNDIKQDWVIEVPGNVGKSYTVLD